MFEEVVVDVVGDGRDAEAMGLVGVEPSARASGSICLILRLFIWFDGSMDRMESLIRLLHYPMHV
jgi:hypothetical protein